MNVTCHNCKEPNINETFFCKKCHKPLLSQSVIIQKLLQKQFELEVRHQQELTNLKEQLNFLRQSIQKSNIPNQEHERVYKIAKPEIKENKQEAVVITTKKQTTKPKRKNIIKEFITQNTHFLEPVQHIIELVSKVYNKHRTEGKLPVFFMTIAGIVAILFGVGYLMQYTFQYLDVFYEKITKVSLGFLMNIIIGGIGIKLNFQKKILQEYGSSLIGLALILNYLLIYYLSGISEFPLISSAVFGFLLIFLNTVAGIVLAIKFETKIVSVLSLIGGALAPFYLNSTSNGTLYYLYLWFLVVGSNYIAYKIKWQALHYLSFVVSMVLLEIAVFNYVPSSILFNIYYHLFAYLFFYYIFFDKRSIKKNFKKSELILLVSSLSFLLFNLYHSNENALIQLGLIFIFNSLIFGTLLIKNWSNSTKKFKIVVLVVIGSFVGLAIPSLFDQVFIGLFWSFEALALILLGFVYALPLVRKEGYLILSIAIFKLIFESNDLILYWRVTLWHNGFINYSILGILLIVLWYITEKYIKKLQKFEKTLLIYCRELVPIWASSIFFLCANELIGIWSLNLAIIPLFGLVFWKKKFNTRFTDIFALVHLLFLLLSFQHSTEIVGSYYFFYQKLYAQIAFVEFMLSLWFIQKFYEQINESDSNTYKMAKIFRIGFFFLIPIIFIEEVNRHINYLLDAGLWIGMFITYLFHKKLKFKALLYELYIILTFAFLLSFTNLSIISLCVSLSVLIIISIIEKAHKEEYFFKSNYQLFLSLVPYLIITSITLLYFDLTNKIGLTISGFLIFLIIYFKNQFALILKTFSLGIILAAVLNFIGLIILFFKESLVEFSFTLINLILYTLILINKKQWYDLEKKLTRWNLANVFLQIQIVLFYIVVLKLLNIDLSGLIISILLVFHAIILLFASLKNNISILNKSSIVLFGIAILKIVFHDIRDFEIAQKVVVLIIIGLLLLIAAYLYVIKLKKHFDAKIKTPDEKQ